MKTRRVFLFLSFLAVGALFCSVHFSCASGPTVIADDTHFTKPTEWKKSESPYLVMGQIHIDSGGELTIEPGTVVKMEINKGKINVFGKLTAVGTQNDKIIFTSIRDDGSGSAQKGDWQDINISGGGASAKIKYAQITYGGGGSVDDAIIINNNDNVSITRSEIKFNRYAGIKIVNSLPTIEENVITNNWYGVYSPDSTKTPVLKNNSIYANSYFGTTARNIWSGILSGHIDARHNWWGSDSGPTHKDNPNGKGDKISDNVSFDPWLGKDTNDDTPDPAIIIPGIMGSWEVNGKWKLDPLLRSYENLKKAMDENGYTPGEDMFDFPYQWRNSNVENAELLRDAIDVVKERTKRPKVDLIAHSMGGLLAREYIESDYYQNDVDQLITLGTPHAGAPKAYLMWEAGEFTDLAGILAKKLFNREAEKAGYDSLFHYIQNRPMKSVKELLPQYDYIFDLDINRQRKYSDGYPKNDFLENLNSASGLNKMSKVEFTNIYGEVNKKNTIKQFDVIDAPAFGDYWKHGYPKDYYSLFWGTEGVIYGEGDETVPIESVLKITANQNIKINSSHNQIPTEAQQDVVELLTGKRPANKIISEGPEIKEILLVQVYCPVDLQVISPSGGTIGKDFENGEDINGISGAIYINNGENEEFIVIPNPEDGEYQILAKGTDKGDYEIEVVKISEDDETGEMNESSQTITGEARQEIQKESKIEIDGNSVKKVEKLTISEPTIEPVSLEIRTEVSSSSAENNISAPDNQSKIQKLDILKNDIRQYFETNQIKKRKVAAEITKKLSKIRVYLKNYATGTKIKKIKIAKTKANQDIGKLIRFINKKSPKFITEEAKKNLIGDLNDLKID